MHLSIFILKILSDLRMNFSRPTQQFTGILFFFLVFISCDRDYHAVGVEIFKEISFKTKETKIPVYSYQKKVDYFLHIVLYYMIQFNQYLLFCFIEWIPVIKILHFQYVYVHHLFFGIVQFDANDTFDRMNVIFYIFFYIFYH